MELIQTANGADNTLGGFSAISTIFNDLKVLVAARLLETGEHGPPFRTSQFSYLEIDRSKEIAIFCGTTFSTFSKSDPILARVSAPQAPGTVKEKLYEKRMA